MAALDSLIGHGLGESPYQETKNDVQELLDELGRVLELFSIDTSCLSTREYQAKVVARATRVMQRVAARW